MFRSVISSIVKRSRNVRNGSSSCQPVDNYNSTQLAEFQNGMKVATIETGSPVACVSLFVAAGPRYEHPCNNGITHFIEHMAYKGFSHMKKKDLEASFESSGAKLTVKTLRDFQVFSAYCFSEYVPMVIDIFHRVITDLSVPENEVKDERCNIYRECMYTDIDPKVVLFDYLHQCAFQGTSLAQRVIGPSQNLDMFSSKYAAEFISDHYQPFRLVLASVGGVCHKDIVIKAENTFGAKNSIMPCPSQEPCRFTGSEVRFRDDSMPMAHVAIAVEGPAYMTKDYYAMYVLNLAMGSWHASQGGGINNGFPIARACAMENVAFGYKPFFIPYKDVSLWGVHFIAKKLDVEDMLYNVQSQWMHFCCELQHCDYERGLNAADLKAAKEMSGPVNTCYDLGTQLLYTGASISYEDKCKEFRNFDTIVLRNIAFKYIYDQCPAVAAVGPVEGLPEYNRIRAGMYWLRF